MIQLSPKKEDRIKIEFQIKRKTKTVIFLENSVHSPTISHVSLIDSLFMVILFTIYLVVCVVGRQRGSWFYLKWKVKEEGM